MGSYEDAFRRRVKYEREKRGWSQADLARRLNDRGGKFHASTIAKIEDIASDRPRSIRLDEAMQIANAFKMQIDDLFGYQIDPKYSIDDRIQRSEKTMIEIAVEIQNRISQLEIEKLALSHLYREVTDKAEAYIERLVQELFGEIFQDDPRWEDAISSPDINNDPDLEAMRATVLQVGHAWATLQYGMESLQRGTSTLIGSWISVDTIEPLIQEFKYFIRNSPSFRLFSDVEKMRSSGILHSRYDSVQEILHDESDT